MFVSPAYAQAADGGFGGIEAFLPLILIFIAFYFFLIRPKQKKAKEHKAMLGAIRRGDKVVTGDGIFGTVTKVIDDNVVAVEIADGVKVRVQRGLISSVMVKRKDVSVKAQGEATRIEVGDIQVEATKTLEVLTTASSTAFANNLPVVGSAFNAAVEPVLKVLSIPDIADGMDAPFEERAPDIAEGVDVLFEERASAVNAATQAVYDPSEKSPSKKCNEECSECMEKAKSLEAKCRCHMAFYRCLAGDFNLQFKPVFNIGVNITKNE